MTNLSRGFGLIGLLLALAIIALASWSMYSSFLKPQNGGTAELDQYTSAINEAKKAKQLLEQRNTVNPDSSEKNTSPLR
jgi:type II secretory pathway component PulJ